MSMPPLGIIETGTLWPAVQLGQVKIIGRVGGYHASRSDVLLS